MVLSKDKGLLFAKSALLRTLWGGAGEACQLAPFPQPRILFQGCSTLVPHCLLSLALGPLAVVLSVDLETAV